jgi:hypothetical protein
MRQLSAAPMIALIAVITAAGFTAVADGAGRKAGTIDTLAGTGKPGLSGDRGPAKNVPYLDPRALAVDGKGNLLIADTGENRVRIAYRIARPTS